MTNKLLTGLRKNQNVTFTENGAISNRSTLSNILDFYFHVSARRGQDNTNLFAKAYSEDKTLALKAAFNMRDIRAGKGERNSFKQVLVYLYENDKPTFEKIVELVPFYGRWTDILPFVDNVVVRNAVVAQLRTDRNSKNPSLLAKWMPSQNASSKETIALANKWIKVLSMTPREYRKMLTELRKKLVLVETLMSAGEFGKINYEHVPSRASMLLRKAFSKRDAERYVAYLEAVKKGDKKINASTLYPHELVAKYLQYRYGSVDETVEAQWKALPNYCEDGENQNAITVVDVSSSMSGLPMQIAIALGLYIAERTVGAFHDYFITFSQHPTLERVVGNSLCEKVKNLSQADWGGNTNLQKVVDLILNTAVHNKVSQDEMPKKLYIVSDMQFDSAMGRYSNFDAMKRKYAAAGYEFPVIVFWNVDSRHDETPATADDRGAFLVSGYSPTAFKDTINAKATNPMELMLEVLNGDRYAAIDEALR